MKNKTKTTLIIAGIVLVALLLILIAGCLKCGDGICQRGEERKGSCPEDCITSPSNTPVKSINFLENIGGRLDLSKEDVIVFDSKGPDGYYDVYMMNMDGTKRKCLTCDKVQVPQKHNGQPAWHPSGDFIVFQSVDPELKGLPKILSEREKVLTGPGAGVNNNLWLTDKDGERFWQLTEVEDKKGVLHPHFSHDGKKLIWAEIVDQKVEPSGDWVIKIADVFIGENSAKLKNIIVLKPGNMRFFETHGFSADDSKILFSATPDGYYSNLDIYSYDLFTKELKQHTGPDSEWDEHAQYSPDGKKIVWMSSKGISQKIQQYKVKTDYWIMDSNGENKKRITFFNDRQAKNYIEGGVAAADNAWTSDGKKILGYIIVREHQADKNVLIEFENGDERPICGNGICEEGETAENCPEDCESVKYKLTCISTYTTNWHWSKCRECKRGYTLDKCETRGHIISRETCEKNYKTECLENPKCARGDEEIGREECGGENKKTECKVKGLEEIGEGCFPKWSPDGSLIAYTKESNNNDYQIYTMKPDGSDIKCLTCDRPGLANTRWRGQPYWHPSGEYIIFTAETTKYPRKGIGTTARPGIGRNHNIWIMTSDGSKFWQITDYPDNWGVIRPSFSHDGKTLLWNEEFMMEKYPHGKPGVDKHPGCWWGSENQKYRKGEELCAWRIKLANISFESKELEISNIRHIDPPDGFTVIEIAGFMPNDIGFIYSYCDIKKQGGRCVWGDIYTSDLNGSISSFWQLTDSFHVHDESPEFSPDGKKIIWATSAGGDPGEGEEVWLMDAEGGNKIRLTYFAEPNHNEYDPIGRQITEMTWSPDGKNVVFGHVSDEKRGSPHLPSTLYKLTFKGACGNQIISRPVCGNGICESGETAENCL
ncbi:hypothetical protein C4E22_06950 [ANME-1 cluster archaeon AG-394-G06]|nr:hypothetical protein [ANME-1 cluster archaeon AG-394-G06]